MDTKVFVSVDIIRTSPSIFFLVIILVDIYLKTHDNEMYNLVPMKVVC